MNAVEFFSHPEVKLPLVRPKEKNDFGAFIKEKLCTYRRLIDQLDTSDFIADSIKGKKDTIEVLCDSIEKAIVAYHGGWPQRAYCRLQDGIEFVLPSIQHLSIESNPGAVQMKQLYRLRIAGPEEGPFTKEGLFHIPYEERYKVKRQRYSIPGLPCLYLGASLYVCWVEMKRPAFDSLHMARFEAVPNIRFLDLSKAPQTHAAFMVKFPDASFTAESASLATCWPLMAACSVKKAHEESPFIEEYIVPQLLLQWVTEQHKVDGVAYFSVRLEPRMDTYTAYTNFVFPAKGDKSTGICDTLRRKFKLTEPASWQLLAGDLHLNPGVIVEKTKPEAYEMTLEFVRGQPKTYGRTEFGLMETELIKLPADYLT
jgi:hypothetical protein